MMIIINANCQFCYRLIIILTHWGRVTHICVGNLTIIASDSGLPPTIFNVFIFICFLRMFELLSCMYLSFNHALEVMKNTTYIEKCLEIDTVVILTFTKKVYFILYSKKNVFAFKKKWYFIGPKIQLFLLIKFFCFFVFFKLGFEHCTLWSEVDAGKNCSWT